MILLPQPFISRSSSGIPNDLATSTLHIKVLPNATEQTYTLSIHANILLTPTNNHNNSTSPQITKNSNFTIKVSPLLTLPEQISIAWSGFGSAINGFVTLLAANNRDWRYYCRMVFKKIQEYRQEEQF
jgi:hypothetical protein